MEYQTSFLRSIFRSAALGAFVLLLASCWRMASPFDAASFPEFSEGPIVLSNAAQACAVELALTARATVHVCIQGASLPPPADAWGSGLAAASGTTNARGILLLASGRSRLGLALPPSPGAYAVYFGIALAGSNALAGPWRKVEVASASEYRFTNLSSSRITLSSTIYPNDMVLAPGGGLYVAGISSGMGIAAIRAIDGTGQFVSEFQPFLDYAFSDNYLTKVDCLAMGGAHLYMGSMDMGIVLETTLAGTQVGWYGEPFNPYYGDGLLGTPLGIAVDGAGIVYATSGGSIQVFAPGGAFLRKFATNAPGTGIYRWLVDLVLVPPDRIATLDLDAKRVEVWRTNGEFQFAFGKKGTNIGEFNVPIALTVDARGAFLVADASNACVEQFSSDGVWQGRFGRRGDGPGEFRSPSAVVATPEGRILVLDSVRRDIQVFE